MTTLAVNKPAPQRSLWPYAIIAAFVLFGCFIGFMVRQAMSTSVDLVSKDYYAQELAHQQRINAAARTAALPAGTLDARYDAAAATLTLLLPARLAGQQPQGQVQFFRPSDQSLDFHVPLRVDAAGQQRLSTAKLRAGYWRVRLTFEAEGQAYYLEKDVVVD
jgi:nitrogen fixation protein FixH